MEIFENGLIAFPGSPTEVRRICADLGLTIVTCQPFRDFEGMPEGRRQRGTGGFGPYLVTPDEVGDSTDLDLETRVNGEVVQSTNTSLMIFGIPRIIEYCSTIFPLAPGDVLVTVSQRNAAALAAMKKRADEIARSSMRATSSTVLPEDVPDPAPKRSPG